MYSVELVASPTGHSNRSTISRHRMNVRKAESESVVEQVVAANSILEFLFLQLVVGWRSLAAPKKLRERTFPQSVHAQYRREDQ